MNWVGSMCNKCVKTGSIYTEDNDCKKGCYIFKLNANVSLK